MWELLWQQWPIVVGYVFSVLFGDRFIRPLIIELYKYVGWKFAGAEKPLHLHELLPRMVGLIERFLYTASWQTGYPGFIGVWLVLKAAGGWKYWTEDRPIDDNEDQPIGDENKKKIPGRSNYNIFLIGTGVSVAYGILGALIIEWSKEGLFLQAILVPIVLISGTIALRFVIAKTRKKPNEELREKKG